jgi:hypothetical protein
MLLPHAQHRCWTPGHIDIEGNKEADKEAKMAAEHGSSTLFSKKATLAVTENVTTQQISSSADIPRKTEASGNEGVAKVATA